MAPSSRTPRIVTAGLGWISGFSQSPAGARLRSQRMTATKPNRRFPLTARRSSLPSAKQGASTSSARTAARRDRSPRWRERERRGSRRMANRCCIGRECQFGARCIGGAAHASGTLQIVAAAGGEPRTLASGFASARFGIWAPDNTHILFLGEKEASDPARTLDWYLTSRNGGTIIRTGALDALQKSGVTGTPVPSDWDATDNSVTPGEYRQRRIESLEDQTRRGRRPHRSATPAIDVWHRDRTKPGARERRSCGVHQPRGKRRRVASTARSRYGQGRRADGTHHRRCRARSCDECER